MNTTTRRAARGFLMIGRSITALCLAAACDHGISDAAADWGGGAQSPYVPAGYELTFADNFDSLNITNGENGAGEGQWISHFAGWGVRHLEGNNDQALKADAAYPAAGGRTLASHQIRLHEITPAGTIRLSAMPAPGGEVDGFPYVGGMISGERLHAQRYGYWEARVRVASISTGVHWAFWLLPDDNSWPPEIDMLEVVGSNPENVSDANQFFFNSHSGRDDEITKVSPPRGLDAWYTLGFLWTEDDMRWFLDGAEVRHRPNFITDKELYFLVSPEIGGHWVGSPDDTTRWPSAVEIDYVRVYRTP